MVYRELKMLLETWISKCLEPGMELHLFRSVVLYNLHVHIHVHVLHALF
jgi:hypothetical protein